MTIQKSINVPIKENKYEAINSSIPRTDHLTEIQKNSLDRLIKNYSKLFTNLNE